MLNWEHNLDAPTDKLEQMYVPEIVCVHACVYVYMHMCVKVEGGGRNHTLNTLMILWPVLEAVSETANLLCKSMEKSSPG